MGKVQGIGPKFVAGACFEETRSTPFAPWIEILRSLVQSKPKEALRKVHPTILSELGRLVPGVALEPVD